jgi:hypothetical protein
MKSKLWLSNQSSLIKISIFQIKSNVVFPPKTDNVGRQSELYGLTVCYFQYQDEGVTLKVPESIKNCTGAPSVYDVQADEIPLTDFQALTHPVPVLR